MERAHVNQAQARVRLEGGLEVLEETARHYQALLAALRSRRWHGSLMKEKSALEFAVERRAQVQAALDAVQARAEWEAWALDSHATVLAARVRELRRQLGKAARRRGAAHKPSRSNPLEVLSLWLAELNAAEERLPPPWLVADAVVDVSALERPRPRSASSWPRALLMTAFLPTLVATFALQKMGVPVKDDLYGAVGAVALVGFLWRFLLKVSGAPLWPGRVVLFSRQERRAQLVAFKASGERTLVHELALGDTPTTETVPEKGETTTHVWLKSGTKRMHLGALGDRNAQELVERLKAALASTLDPPASVEVAISHDEA